MKFIRINITCFVTAILVLSGLVMLGGCASSEVTQQDGPPVIVIESPHLDYRDYRGLIAKAYTDEGYSIVEQEPRKLVMKTVTDEGFFSVTSRYLEFDFISLRNETKIIGRVYRVETTSSTGGPNSMTDVSEVEQYARPVQEFLDRLRDRTRNENAFENLTEITIQGSPDDRGDTE